MLVMIIAMLIVGGVGLVIFNTMQTRADAAAWQAASSANTASAYSAYLDEYPKGRFIYTARNRIKALEEAATAETAANGADNASQNEAAEALKKDNDSWAIALKLDTFDAYGDYLAAHANGAHAEAARTRQREIDTAQTRAAQEAEKKRLEADRADAQRKADDNAWSIAKSVDTRSAYESYLAAYASGRHASEARAALKRFDTPAPYSLERLHPDVREVVEAARTAAKSATMTAEKARVASEIAEKARSSALSGRAETVHRKTATAEYWGETNAAELIGFGIVEFISGDQYLGEWSKSKPEGLGVMKFAEGPNNRTGRVSAEGEWKSGEFEGYGVLTIDHGASTMVGHFKYQFLNGLGVYTLQNGGRFEGNFKNNGLDGLGVSWTADGRVNSAGRWKNGRLVESLKK